jgi:hypothetical protein
MYFQGFTIGILQEGEELREYCLQAKNTKVSDILVNLSAAST